MQSFVIESLSKPVEKLMLTVLHLPVYHFCCHNGALRCSMAILRDVLPVWPLQGSPQYIGHMQANRPHPIYTMQNGPARDDLSSLPEN